MFNVEDFESLVVVDVVGVEVVKKMAPVQLVEGVEGVKDVDEILGEGAVLQSVKRWALPAGDAGGL